MIFAKPVQTTAVIKSCIMGNNIYIAIGGCKEYKFTEIIVPVIYNLPRISMLRYGCVETKIYFSFVPNFFCDNATASYCGFLI